LDTGRPSIEALRAKLIKYLKDNKKAFMDLSVSQPRYKRDDINAVPGYQDKVKKQRWFYFTARVLNAIIGTGRGASELKQQLVTEGLLAQGKGGRFVVQRRVFKGGKGNQNSAWVHAVKRDILDERRPKAD
jgi:hypothetical protein